MLLIGLHYIKEKILWHPIPIYIDRASLGRPGTTSQLLVATRDILHTKDT